MCRGRMQLGWAFLQQTFVDDLRTLGFMHGRRGRMRNQMDGVIFTRFTAMGHIAHPLGVSFVAVARLGIVGGLYALRSP
jgi:hypothetical protein